MKNSIKKTIQAYLPSTVPPVLIASMGRSGSTLIYHAVAEGMASHRFSITNTPLARLVRLDLFEVEGTNFRNGIVYKTHCFPTEVPATENLKVIFSFGSASDAAISFLACDRRYGRHWTLKHMEHLRAQGSFEEIFDRDILRLEEQIDTWLNTRRLNVLAIRYETMWKHLNEISRFVGFPVQLPPWRERESNRYLDEETIQVLRNSYERLDRKIDRFADFQTNAL